MSGEPTLTMSSSTITLTGCPPITLHRYERDATIMSSRTDVTGLVHWSAAEALGQLICHRADWFRGRRVVELGCGAGLAGVVASRFASEVVFTDAADACCRLALHNAIANGAVARSDSGVMDGECVVSVDVLRWGEDDTAFVATHGTFHAIIASEVLYIHWDDDVAMSAVALSFLTTAAALLWPTTPSSSSLPCEDDSTDGGIILFVYTPRYRGMGPAIRAAAAALSLHMCTLHRSCVVNEEQAATGKFFSLRTVVLSRCASSLRGFVCDLPSGTASDEEDWFNGEEEEDTQPLATIAAGDVFT